MCFRSNIGKKIALLLNAPFYIVKLTLDLGFTIFAGCYFGIMMWILLDLFRKAEIKLSKTNQVPIHYYIETTAYVLYAFMVIRIYILIRSEGPGFLDDYVKE